MELYNFYQIINTTLRLLLPDSAINVERSIVWGAIGGAAFWLVLFILQGIGIYTMAKRQGLKHKWLAFLPFGNIAYMGKLAGECGFFGHKMKNAAIYAMIAQIVASILAILCILAQCYLCVNYTLSPLEVEGQLGIYEWNGLAGFGVTVKKFYNIGSSVLMIVGLISQLLMLVLLIGLYKKYTPKNYFMLSTLTILAAVPVFPLGLASMARFIIVFKVRKREPIDFEAYVRKQQEEFIRRQQQYYQTYGNPYNRPPYNGNPYGMGGYQNNPTPPKQEEPFGEFSSEEKGSADTETSTSANENDADEFFN